jgi:hypothetical protein
VPIWAVPRFPFDKSALGNVSVAVNVVGLACMGYGVACGIQLGSASASAPAFVHTVAWAALHIALALTLPVVAAYGTLNRSERALAHLRNALAALLALYTLEFFVRVVLFSNCSATSSNAYVDCALDVVTGLALAPTVATAATALIWLALAVAAAALQRREYTMTLRDAFNAPAPARSDRVPLIDKKAAGDGVPPPVGAAAADDDDASHNTAKKTKKKKKKSKTKDPRR